MVFTPTRGRVNERPPYRFDGRPADHDLSTDVLAFARGDGAAGARLNAWVSDTFVSSGNVAGLRGTTLAGYDPEAPYATPLWSAIAKPAPFTDPGPFIVPAFATGTNLVDTARTEGADPTPATLTTSGAPLTPTAVMGEIDLTRELADQRDGNPILSAALLAEMQRAYAEALEGRAAALLAAVSSPTTIALTPASTGATLVNALTAGIAALAHGRGGNGMRAGFLHSALYTALTAAVDSSGRRLVEDAPTEDGQADGVIVAGRALRAAWAVTGASWLVDPRYVHGWATPPRELVMQRGVANVSLGILGYAAVQVSRPAYIRKITY